MTISERSRRLPYILLGLTCLLGYIFKAHCGPGWVNGIQYTSGCYSDAVPFWGLRGVADGALPYLQARMEYPVLTGALIWVEGVIARTLGGAGANAATFLLVVSAVNAGLAFLVLWLMERASVDRARLYAWAAAPPLILYLGHNWDMLAVALAVAALLAARRGAAFRAVQLAAFGAAAKLFPVLMLPLIGLGALFRRDALWRERIVTTVLLAIAAVLAWGAVNLPVAAVAFTNWSEFYAFSGERSGTAASIWELLATFGVWNAPIPLRNMASFAAFAIGALAIVLLGWRRHGAQSWLLFTPVLAWFLLTNKVYSPQFDLWLYPFLVLTSYRLWPLLWFALGDLAAYFAEFWWFAGMEGRTPSATPGDIALAAAIRGAAMLWIIVAALRQPAPAWITPPADSPRHPDRPTPAG
ncbi:hypothetical protein [Sphingomonas hylomeconis]|uniref:DUF2029 domain-containing protein n=1 Tax=Sphingomonas hylomeconis TaxID=1395958 RepID=A0ABV7SWW5_9SPHN|nr:hypothetical protein [Sphingomonas hylomeconis]